MTLDKYADGIRIRRSGPKQHFTPGFVSRGVGEGWLSLGRGKLTLHTLDGDVTYTVLRVPGKYEDGPIHYYDCEKD